MERTNVFTSGVDSITVIDHSELILRKESQEITDKRGEISNSFKKRLRASIGLAMLPKVLMCVGILFLFYGVIDLIQGKELNIPFLVIGIVLIGLYLIVKFVLKSKQSGLFDEIGKELEDLNELSGAELNVPSDAKDVEVFAYLYNKDGDPSKAPECYDNDPTKIFEEDGRLCFYYGGAIIGIDKNSIEQVVKVNSPITFSSWDDDRGDFKQYDIVKNVTKYQESFTANEYYSIRFNFVKDFEILVPSYDIQPFLDILDVTPIEE